MDCILSVEQVRELTTIVRNKRKGFLTNFYLDEFKHNVWIQNGDFFFEWIRDSLFLVKKSEDFWNVFYVSTTEEDFDEDLNVFASNHKDFALMFDIVGREAQCFAMLDVFRKQGFKVSASLVRMTRMTEPMDFVPDKAIAKATNVEVEDVYNLLHQYFDEKTEQIPYIEELHFYAREGHVLVCHENGQIAGFLIYEINASTLYLRYWFTHPDFRDKKVGSRLLRQFFDEGKDTKRQLFWVIQSNENAIKRYRHYGFKEENMFDFVMQIN